MKIIEAMRKIKINLGKITEYKKLVAQYCADYEIQEPTYPDQIGMVRSWLMATHDLLEETEKLKRCISETNLATQVTVELDGKRITKSITEWIARRDTLSKLELEIWSALGDKGLSTQAMKNQINNEVQLVKVRRYFDAKERDAKISLFSAEPHTIDGALEVANATTELI